MSKPKIYFYKNKTNKELPKEEWKDIPGFETYYQASTLGRIRSLDRHVAHQRLGTQFIRGRILSQSIAKNINLKKGDAMIDLRVSLNLEGHQYYFNTRRLVYITFVNKKLSFVQDGKYIINKDCDGFNCCLNNLALVTKSEKQKRVIERGRMDSHLKTADRSSWKNYGGYSRRKKIKQYKDRKLVAVFESIRQAARTTGFGEKEIIMVAKGRWSHYHGYKWKYAD